MALTLTRESGESVTLFVRPSHEPREITIDLRVFKYTKVKATIDAPPDVLILRNELGLRSQPRSRGAA